MLSPTERAERLEQYRRGYDDLRAALADCPREMWQFKPSATDWSIHEILIHLPDSEANSCSRFRAPIAEPGITLFAYDQDVWAIKLDYHNQNVDDALEFLRWIRKMNYDLLKMQPDEVWSNTVIHPENGEMSLDDVLVLYAEHIPGHIAQIKANFAAWEAANG